MLFTRNMSVRVFTYPDTLDISINNVTAFNRMRMRPQDAKESDTFEENFGFCNPDDASQDDVLVADGEFLVTAYVNYKRPVSSKALKFELEEWCKEWKVKHPEHKFVPRDVSKAEKENIKMRLVKTAPIQPSMVPVIIDPVRHMVFIFSLSNTIVERVTGLLIRIGVETFEETFINFVDTDEMLDANEFGGNFLTWLWYMTETNSYREYVGGTGVAYTLVPDDGITVVGGDGEVCTVRGDIREARNGIFNGKHVDKFAFVLQFGEISVPCIVWANGMIARVSYKIPRESIDANGVAFELSAILTHVREFLRVVVTEYAKVYNDADESERLRREIWNWSRGDVCVRAFEDI